MIKYIYTLITLFSINVTASNIDYNEINLLKNAAIAQSMQYQENANTLTKGAENKAKKVIASEKEFLENQQKLLQDTYQNNNQNSKQKYDTNLLVFISFSMPDEAIKELLIDSQKYNASLVIQGLIDNSFDVTLKKITKLVKKSGNIGGIQIDPVLFNKYGIKEVPTYILKESTHYDAKYDVLSGASGIAHALSIFKEQGDVKA
tara:strand:+ start:12777 stop:13388 length:612 start_codon:yes stop_codon:yes gene_type:complete